MKKTSALSIAALIALSLQLGIAQAGVQEIADKCDKCHGTDGNSEDGKVPNIAGMSHVYISDTLDGYAAGDRKGAKYKPEGGEESDMGEVAGKLSKDDIKAISEHYAGKPFKVHVQEADAAMAAMGKKTFDKRCDKCHSDSGTAADDDAGLLMGQWRPYLEEQIKMFENKSRDMPKKMRKKFNKLTAEEKANIIEYLSSGKP